ncbi:MAG: hypothetical protein ACE5KM_06685 [Planctomycetaceae bacterium]
MDYPSLLPAAWNVPEVFRKRLGRLVGRQRAMSADGHLLLILHTPPGPEDAARTGRFFWRQPDGVWKSNVFGRGPGALAKHLDEYRQLIDDLEAQDEAANSAQDYFDVIYRIDPIHRAARNMHAALQQARELAPESREIINDRDRAYQLERSAELLHRDARNGMEMQVARRAEEQAAGTVQMTVSAHRLNVLAAFFFPIITLCTVFGVNVKHGLEEVAPPWPLLGILAAGLLLGVVLKAWITAAPKPPNTRSRR